MKKQVLLLALIMFFIAVFSISFVGAVSCTVSFEFKCTGTCTGSPAYLSTNYVSLFAGSREIKLDTRPEFPNFPYYSKDPNYKKISSTLKATSSAEWVTKTITVDDCKYKNYVLEFSASESLGEGGSAIFRNVALTFDPEITVNPIRPVERFSYTPNHYTTPRGIRYDCYPGQAGYYAHPESGLNPDFGLYPEYCNYIANAIGTPFYQEGYPENHRYTERNILAYTFAVDCLDSNNDNICDQQCDACKTSPELTANNGFVYNSQCVEDKDKDSFISFGTYADTNTERCLGDCNDDSTSDSSFCSNVVCCQQVGATPEVYFWGIRNGEFGCDDDNAGNTKRRLDSDNQCVLAGISNPAKTKEQYACNSPAFAECSFCTNPKATRKCGLDTKCETFRADEQGNIVPKTDEEMNIAIADTLYGFQKTNSKWNWNGLDNGYGVAGACTKNQQCVIYGRESKPKENTPVNELIGSQYYWVTSSEDCVFYPGATGSHNLFYKSLTTGNEISDNADCYYAKYKYISIPDKDANLEANGWKKVLLGYVLMQDTDYIDCLPTNENTIINSRYGELDYNTFLSTNSFLSRCSNFITPTTFLGTKCVQKDKCVDGVDNNKPLNLFSSEPANYLFFKNYVKSDFKFIAFCCYLGRSQDGIDRVAYTFDANECTNLNGKVKDDSFCSRLGAIKPADITFSSANAKYEVRLKDVDDFSCHTGSRIIKDKNGYDINVPYCWDSLEFYGDNDGYCGSRTEYNQILANADKPEYTAAANFLTSHFNDFPFNESTLFPDCDNYPGDDNIQYVFNNKRIMVHNALGQAVALVAGIIHPSLVPIANAIGEVTLSAEDVGNMCGYNTDRNCNKGYEDETRGIDWSKLDEGITPFDNDNKTGVERLSCNSDFNTDYYCYCKSIERLWGEQLGTMVQSTEFLTTVVIGSITGLAFLFGGIPVIAVVGTVFGSTGTAVLGLGMITIGIIFTYPMIKNIVRIGIADTPVDALVYWNQYEKDATFVGSAMAAGGAAGFLFKPLSIKLNLAGKSLGETINTRILPRLANWLKYGKGQIGAAAAYLRGICTNCLKTGPKTGCFLAGTKILMEDGSYKNIEDIKTGDRVAAYDVENNIAGNATVTETFVRNETKYRIIEYEIEK